MKRYLRDRMARWVRKRQGPDRLPLILARRRLYILPTRMGVGFGLLLILMLVAGLNYANSIALFLTFLLTGFTLVSMHQCHRNLQGTRLVAATAQPTFARRPGVLELIFESPAPHSRFRIAVSIGEGPSEFTDIPSGGRGRIQLPVEASKRGLQVLDRLYLVTTHPFGLFRTWTWIHAAIEMLVYPYPGGTLPMPTHSGAQAGSRSIANSGADEWLGLRPFRDGDSPRQVDWKAYAREAPLLVKEYAATGSELRMFDFSALGSLPVEARLEQLARWVVEAELGGERYGLTLPTQNISPDRGPEHRHRCLQALAMFGTENHGEDQST